LDKYYGNGDFYSGLSDRSYFMVRAEPVQADTIFTLPTRIQSGSLGRLGFFLEGGKVLGLGDFAVAKGFYHFKDFCPRWERAMVIFFISVDCHQEGELLIGHFPFFGGFSLVASSVARASVTVQPDTSVNNTFSTFYKSAGRFGIFVCHLHALHKLTLKKAAVLVPNSA
jgi:hypothetical protein